MFIDKFREFDVLLKLYCNNKKKGAGKNQNLYTPDFCQLLAFYSFRLPIRHQPAYMMICIQTTLKPIPIGNI